MPSCLSALVPLLSLSLLAALCIGSGPYQPLGPTVPKLDGLIDEPMYKDPRLIGTPLRHEFLKGVKPLWLEALRQTDAEIRRQAVSAFIDAHRQGMPDLEDVVPALIKVVAEDPHRFVRLEAARALLQFDARKAATVLLEQSEKETGSTRSDLIVTIDPSLARWNHRPARDVWLRRLKDADLPRQAQASAMRSLGQVGDRRALDSLRSFAADQELDASWRLEAARAAAQIAQEGLVPTAEALVDDKPIDRLIAASLLAAHSDQAAVALLRRLAANEDEDPTVVATSLNILNDIDPGLVHTAPQRWLEHPDPNVRLAVTRSVSFRNDTEAVVVLADRLNDSDVAVRHLAREVLTRMDQERALSGAVRDAAMNVFADNGWRGLEQAALLMGALDHEPAADRLLELMNHPRGEVRVASTAALRQLAVPATLPAILKQTERLSERVLYLHRRWIRSPAPIQQLRDEPLDQFPEGLLEVLPENFLEQVREQHTLTLELNNPADVPRAVELLRSQLEEDAVVEPDLAKAQVRIRTRLWEAVQQQLNESGVQTRQPLPQRPEFTLTKNEKKAVQRRMGREWESRRHETSQLMMAMGLMRYREAEPLMRRYIPKHSGFDHRARAAAFYAMGKLHEDDPDPDLIEKFIERLSDINPFDPEDPRVRRFSAIALGRMRMVDDNTMEVLRHFYKAEELSLHIGGSTRWALMRITGESLPPLPAGLLKHRGWFLEPLAKLKDEASNRE